MYPSPYACRVGAGSGPEGTSGPASKRGDWKWGVHCAPFLTVTHEHPRVPRAAGLRHGEGSLLPLQTFSNFTFVKLSFQQ